MPTGTRAKSIVALLLINSLLVALYFLSRSGSTTHVHLEANGDLFTAYVDGAPTSRALVPGFDHGGIGFRQMQNDFLPANPLQQGIENVRVMDLDTGKILFSDDFSSKRAEWKSDDNDWFIDRRGIFTSTHRARLASVGRQPWRNVAVDLDINTCLKIDIFLRSGRDPAQTGVAYSFSPWRDFSSNFFAINNGVGILIPGDGPGLDGLKVSEALRAIGSTLFAAYPIAAFVVLFWILASWLFQKSRSNGESELTGEATLRESSRWDSALQESRSSLGFLLGIGLLAIVAFAYFLYIGVVVLDGIPHVPDEIAYHFQAKIFAGGALSVPAPPPSMRGLFDFPGSLIFYEGRWFSQYPFGHPLALMFGHLVDAPWLIPPLLASTSLIFTYLIGKRLFSPRVGFIAAGLMAFSPFYWMNGGNYMSHTTAVFYLLVGCWCFFELNERSRPILGVIGGLAFGLLLNTRPLSSTVVAIPLGIYAVWRIFSATGRRMEVFRRYVPSAAAILFMVAAFFAYNRALTGNMLIPPYTLGNTATAKNLGFSSSHTFNRALLDFYTNLTLFLTVISGWPNFLALFLPFVLVALGGFTCETTVLLVVGMMIPIGYLLYNGNFIMYGPRFWYECIPFFFLVSAVALEKGPDLVAYRLKTITGYDTDPWIRAGGRWCGYALVILLSARSLSYWVDLAPAPHWPDLTFVPARISDLKDFNFADRRIPDELEAQKIGRAVIFVTVSSGNWWVYGIPLFYMSPFLNGDWIFAHDRGPVENAELLRRFPDRPAYLADYDAKKIVPYPTIAVPPS